MNSEPLFQKYELPVEGYWKDRAYLPTYSGVYFVYAAKVNADSKISDKRLLYVGESENIYERHNGRKETPAWHNRYHDFLLALGPEESLRYTTAKYTGPEDTRRMIQDAIIFRCNPPLNDISTQSYSGRDMEVSFTTSDDIEVPETIKVKNGEKRGEKY